MRLRPTLSSWLGMTLASATAMAQTAPATPPVVAPVVTQSPETTPPPIVIPQMHHDAADVLPAEIANKRRLEKPSAAGTMELTWLGHASWVMRSPSGTTVLIDPWLTNPLAPHDFVMPATIDAILITHGHFDHLGEAAELARKLHVPVIASYELVELLELSNGIGINPGGTVKIKDLTIHATQAVHSSSAMHRWAPEPITTVAEAAPAVVAPAPVEEHVMKGKKGKHGKKQATAQASQEHKCSCMMHRHQIEHHPHLMYAGQAMGYVIDIEAGPTVYHAGDTDVFASMALIREQYHPTIGLLPIGGQYTMGPEGAALAAEILGLEEVLPMHYRTMSSLSGTPDELRRLLDKKARVVAPAPGARVTYR